MRGDAVPSVKNTCTALAMEPLFRIQIINGILLIFDDLHFISQLIDARVGSDFVFVMLGGESAEN